MVGTFSTRYSHRVQTSAQRSFALCIVDDNHLDGLVILGVDDMVYRCLAELACASRNTFLGDLWRFSFATVIVFAMCFILDRCTLSK